MKLHRAVIVAGAALVAAACSGEEPVAAPESTVPVVESIEAPTTTAARAGTSAPETTAVATGTPESLAFASTRDVGRLFEIDGLTQLFDGPGGDVIATLEDGRLVQAGAARSVDGALLVGIIDPNDPTVALGWVDSTDLRSTTQSITRTDPTRANQLGTAARTSGQDSIEVVTRPGGSSVAATLVNRQNVLFSGNSALASDGQTWLEVISTDTGATLGWLPSRNFTEVRSSSALDDSFATTDRSPRSTVAYGAQLPLVQVGLTACNAVQIEIANPSSTQGLAFVFGDEIPSAVAGAPREVWSGSQLFVAPGESTTLTLLNNVASTWYFASLDGERQTDAARAANGGLLGEPGERVSATDVQQVTVPAGTCAFVPPPPVDDGSDEYNTPATTDDEVLEEAEALEGEELETDGEDLEGAVPGIDGEVPEASTTTIATTTTTTTTTVAPTTTAAAEDGT